MVNGEKWNTLTLNKNISHGIENLRSLTNISHGIVILLQVVRNHSREIQMTKTLAAMLDDRNNKAYYNSSFNGNPILRRCRKLQRSTIKPLQIMHLAIIN